MRRVATRRASSAPGAEEPVAAARRSRDRAPPRPPARATATLRRELALASGARRAAATMSAHQRHAPAAGDHRRRVGIHAPDQRRIDHHRLRRPREDAGGRASTPVSTPAAAAPRAKPARQLPGEHALRAQRREHGRREASRRRESCSARGRTCEPGTMRVDQLIERRVAAERPEQRDHGRAQPEPGVRRSVPCARHRAEPRDGEQQDGHARGTRCGGGCRSRPSSLSRMPENCGRSRC